MENALHYGEVRGEDPREIIGTQFVVPTEQGPAAYMALGLFGVLRPIIVVRQSSNRCARFPVIAEFVRQDLQLDHSVWQITWFLQRYATPDAPAVFPYARMVFNEQGRLTSSYDYADNPGFLRDWYSPLGPQGL